MCFIVQVIHLPLRSTSPCALGLGPHMGLAQGTRSLPLFRWMYEGPCTWAEPQANQSPGLSKSRRPEYLYTDHTLAMLPVVLPNLQWVHFYFVMQSFHFAALRVARVFDYLCSMLLCYVHYKEFWERLDHKSWSLWNESWTSPAIKLLNLDPDSYITSY